MATPSDENCNACNQMLHCSPDLTCTLDRMDALHSRFRAKRSMKSKKIYFTSLALLPVLTVPSLQCLFPSISCFVHSNQRNCEISLIKMTLLSHFPSPLVTIRRPRTDPFVDSSALPLQNTLLSLSGGASVGPSGGSPLHSLALFILTTLAWTRSSLVGFHKAGGKARHIRGGATSPTTEEDRLPPLDDEDDNPLWPHGVFDKDVDDIITECLKDPSINIQGVPDYLERQIYRSTIKLTLNAIYRSLAGLHGHRMLGHEFKITRVTRPSSELRTALKLLEMRSDVEATLLENVANKLLANKYVNQPLIPDTVERHLYVNCLKIVFRVLDLLTTSFRVTLCGHDLSIQMEPSTRYAIQQSALRRASEKSAAFSSIDMEKLKEFARHAGVVEAASTSYQDEQKIPWFWQRWLSPANNEFVAEIHASMYSLVLGILDDLLDNTEIEVLSDRIGFDLVAVANDNDDNDRNHHHRVAPKENLKNTKKYRKSLP